MDILVPLFIQVPMGDQKDVETISQMSSNVDHQGHGSPPRSAQYESSSALPTAGVLVGLLLPVGPLV